MSHQAIARPPSCRPEAARFAVLDLDVVAHSGCFVSHPGAPRVPTPGTFGLFEVKTGRQLITTALNDPGDVMPTALNDPGDVMPLASRKHISPKYKYICVVCGRGCMSRSALEVRPIADAFPH